MQIMIDISEDEYFNVMLGPHRHDSILMMNLVKAVQRGIPFHEGHGQLIDSDMLMRYCMM